MGMKPLFAVLVLIALSACGERAEPGTPLAARFMAAEYVGKLYAVDPVHVKQEPVVDGETAKVTALFQNKACDLTLTKNMTANQYGWVTSTIDCHAANQ